MKSRSTSFTFFYLLACLTNVVSGQTGYDQPFVAPSSSRLSTNSSNESMECRNSSTEWMECRFATCLRRSVAAHAPIAYDA